MKKILGLDLGTNSIGWALIEQDFKNKQGNILGMGSRIIPMTQDVIGDFGKGNSISQTADRTKFRSARRLRERFLLRRERLHRVLHILKFLPEHYDEKIDFQKRFGKFKDSSEPKIPYNSNGFVFGNSFDEMVVDFKERHGNLLIDRNGKSCLLPHDWTIYYLRKKALSHKIEKEELAWILLNFNQKRGYYQLRGEEEEDKTNKSVEFHSLQVMEVNADATKNPKGEVWYSLLLENGWIYRRSSKVSLDNWLGKTKDFIVTTDLNPDGSEKKDKDGNVKRSFRAPSVDDWTLIKKKTEHDIEKSKLSVGTYIYDNLLLDPKQKIKGKLVRTIERKFYKQELIDVLTKQAEFHSELNDQALLATCAKELYQYNEIHRKSLEAKDFLHLFVNDLIFFQRPLRSQKNNIALCALETRIARDKEGKSVQKQLRVIAKSNPYFQEFRLLHWLQNLSIYRVDDQANMTQELLATSEIKERLFTYLNGIKEIEEAALIKFVLEVNGVAAKEIKSQVSNYSWNYVKDKKYPCNETRSQFLSRLKKVESASDDFLNSKREMELWHIVYSVSDKEEYSKALAKFATKNGLEKDGFVDAFKRFPPFASDYGSFSQKAILKLLPLMRFGSAWTWEGIDSTTKNRIMSLINGEFDENIPIQIHERVQHLREESQYQNLPLWLAQYIVYGRHSEPEIAGKWTSVTHLEDFLKDFKQHSLRNPIVEQLVTETLRVVRDIWVHYGSGRKNFFDEIHVELGRDMKNSADKRSKISKVVSDQENTNIRLKLLLAELAADATVENVRAYSPMQLEILKIYEEGALRGEEIVEEDILKISKTAQPSSSDLNRYKIWLEQRYRSPYTGQVIPLNRLFTHEYEIEHIIPQSRYFDDSISNKVICEAAINKLKDNMLAYPFIQHHAGAVVDCGLGKKATVFSVEEYETFVKKVYGKNRSKLDKLLAVDLPEKMITRQLNDTRYISKYITSLLSNLVRADSNDDGVNSKNVVPGNGKITGALKNDWGLNDIWNDLILPRFERLNDLTSSKDFTTWNQNYQKYLPTVPLELSRGFSKKRIDHRHHALDALVIACASREHLNFMNNVHALDKNKKEGEKDRMRYDLRAILCEKRFSGRNATDYSWKFVSPWKSFQADAKEHLENMLISFKQNIRVINKATNYYQSYKDESGKLRTDKNGKPVKGVNSQSGVNWAIRKSLHKDTVSGRVHLDREKVAKGKILTATRKPVDITFTAKVIGSITDTGIQKILLNYLDAKGGKADQAFTAEGLEDLNLNIKKYNGGKDHKPIEKVRIFEQGSKFAVGPSGKKAGKYVEAAKGTNLFFAIYQDSTGKRSYESLPLNMVIERQKQGLDSVPEVNEKGARLLFSLSPNDLVYVPSHDEDVNRIDFTKLSSQQKGRIYKMLSCSSYQCYFIRFDVAISIVNKMEYSSLNKMERSIDGLMIKEVCIPIKCDRIGKIVGI